MYCTLIKTNRTKIRLLLASLPDSVLSFFISKREFASFRSIQFFQSIDVWVILGTLVVEHDVLWLCEVVDHILCYYWTGIKEVFPVNRET